GAFTVGDAGGAMVVGPAEGGEAGISKFRCGAISDYHKLCSYKHEESGAVSFNMDMARISAVTLKLCKDLVGPIYDDLDWSPDDVDIFIPHQVGARPFEKVLKIAGVSEDRSIATYPKLGNLASATLPVCFDLLEDQGRVEKGQKMLMVATGSGIVATFLGVVL
ncbi:MAG: 3-oxoacyl-[acyl-carrier-protein] synthase III C-terminal domain-containing protein, partial [Pseudomonadales bacterium]